MSSILKRMRWRGFWTLLLMRADTGVGSLRVCRPLERHSIVQGYARVARRPRGYTVAMFAAAH